MAEVAPALTVTDGGVAKTPLSSDTVTVVPPVGAALVSVTVHVLLPFGPRLVGLHPKVESAGREVRLMGTFCEAPLRVAVTVAL